MKITRKQFLKTSFLGTLGVLTASRGLNAQGSKDGLAMSWSESNIRSHRSIWNFLVNLVAGLIAYTYLPNKPSLDLEPKDLLALPSAAF